MKGTMSVVVKFLNRSLKNRLFGLWEEFCTLLKENPS